MLHVGSALVDLAVHRALRVPLDNFSSSPILIGVSLALEGYTCKLLPSEFHLQLAKSASAKTNSSLHEKRPLYPPLSVMALKVASMYRPSLAKIKLVN